MLSYKIFTPLPFNTSAKYEQYLEFDAELTPLAINSLSKILKKLEYIK
jgi:hypothetical protein